MTPTNAQKLFGFILLKLTTNENRFVEFLCAHNTQTMLIGYMNTFQTQVTVTPFLLIEFNLVRTILFRHYFLNCIPINRYRSISMG